jgi:hypothetical protein
MFRKHAAATKFVSLVYQLNNYVLALLADGRDVFHLDNECAAVKVYSCFFARTPQFGCPGGNELSFHNQPTLPDTIDQRNLQHFLLPASCDKARRTPNSQNRKSLNFKETAPRSRNGEVEEVESVETVERIG